MTFEKLPALEQILNDRKIPKLVKEGERYVPEGSVENIYRPRLYCNFVL